MEKKFLHRLVEELYVKKVKNKEQGYANLKRCSVNINLQDFFTILNNTDILFDEAKQKEANKNK